MDLELSNFVRDFLDLVAKYGKSRIEKKKEKKRKEKRKQKREKERKEKKRRKNLMDLPPNSCFFVFVFLFCCVFCFVL